MMNNSLHSSFKLLFKLTVLSIILQIIPIPYSLNFFMPLWSLLFFSYWLVFHSKEYPLLSAIIVGVITDIFLGDILGQHALSLLISSFFLLYIRHNFIMSSIVGQQILILITSFLFLISYLSVDLFVHSSTINWSLFLSSISTAIIWFIFWLKK